MNGFSAPGRARLAWGGALTACLVAGLIIASGCDDDRHVTFPETSGGAIEGWVSDGLPIDPRDVDIIISDFDRDDLSFAIYVRPDSSGHYAVSVPNGPARVSMRAECGREIFHRVAGLTHDPAAADSVVVAGEVCRVDFACGRVAVDVGLPPEIWGQSLRCGLLRPGESPVYHLGCGVAGGERLATEIRLVKPGDYRLGLRGSDVGYAYLPATLDSLDAETITVRAGEETRHTSEIPALTTLSGTATGSWQTFRFDPPRIQVWHEDEVVGEYPADDDGSFEVRLLAGGAIKLLVSINYVAGYVGGVDFASATVFDMAPGEQRTGITYVESGLELTLVGEYDPTVPNYSYDIYDGSGRVLLRSPHDTSSESGDTNPVRIPNLPPGDVYVVVRPWLQSLQWVGQFYDRQDSLAVADPVLVPPDGQIAQLTVTLEHGGSFHGRLLAAGGEPCPPTQVEISVYSVDDRENSVAWYMSAWEDFYDGETGEFFLDNFANGAYKLRARHSGGSSRWYPGEVDWDDAGAVVIENHADVMLEDWQLPY